MKVKQKHGGGAVGWWWARKLGSERLGRRLRSAHEVFLPSGRSWGADQMAPWSISRTSPKMVNDDRVRGPGAKRCRCDVGRLETTVGPKSTACPAPTDTSPPLGAAVCAPRARYSYQGLFGLVMKGSRSRTALPRGTLPHSSPSPVLPEGKLRTVN